MGRPVFELFHPEELGLARQAHEALRQSGVPTVITHRLRAKDGSYLWFECSVRAIRDPVTGEVQEIHSVTRDVTRRRLAEEWLGASEGQLHGLTAFNPYWLLLGEDERPLPPSAHPAMVALHTGRPVWDRVVGVASAGGRMTWLAVNAIPAVGGDGRATQAVVSFSDVTVVRRQAMERGVTAGHPEAGSLLHGLVPICAQCKQTRDASGAWQPIEEYLRHAAGIECSHSLCPACAAQLFPDVMEP